MYVAKTKSIKQIASSVFNGFSPLITCGALFVIFCCFAVTFSSHFGFRIALCIVWLSSFLYEGFTNEWSLVVFGIDGLSDQNFVRLHIDPILQHWYKAKNQSYRSVSPKIKQFVFATPYHFHFRFRSETDFDSISWWHKGLHSIHFYIINIYL